LSGKFLPSSRVARFFLVQYTKMGENIPNYHKMYQMVVKYIKCPQNGPKVHKIHQHLPLQGPPKCIRITIFGLKINHLATLPSSPFSVFLPTENPCFGTALNPVFIYIQQTHLCMYVGQSHLHNGVFTQSDRYFFNLSDPTQDVVRQK
jgi:hypothetical protein